MEFMTAFFNLVTKDMRDADPEAEHKIIMRDLDLMIAAEKAGFKYIIVPEHHFLDEYSHIAGNIPALGYLAHATERVHLLSGIMNPLPQLMHPVRTAETVAMLDHITEGRFEFGTGRGAGTYEAMAFFPEGTDPSETKIAWADVISELPKMWLQDPYEGYDGKYWRLPSRRILPRMYRAPHPPMWYAAGNLPSYEQSGRMGFGVLGNALQTFDMAEQACAAYRKGIERAEPVGAFATDYVVANLMPFVSEDESRALDWVTGDEFSLHFSLTYRYHDTLPRPEGLPYWPEIKPNYTRAEALALQKAGQLIGTPDQVIETLRRYEALGVHGVIVGIGGFGRDHALETIEVFGKHIIPALDTEPAFRTDRFRDAAARAVVG